MRDLKREPSLGSSLFTYTTILLEPWALTVFERRLAKSNTDGINNLVLMINTVSTCSRRLLLNAAVISDSSGHSSLYKRTLGRMNPIDCLPLPLCIRFFYICLQCGYGFIAYLLNDCGVTNWVCVGIMWYRPLYQRDCGAKWFCLRGKEAWLANS